MVGITVKASEGRFVIEAPFTPDRDRAPRLGDGVRIVEGHFPSSCGSRKNPRLGGAGTVLEVRDVPRGLVDA